MMKSCRRDALPNRLSADPPGRFWQNEPNCNHADNSVTTKMAKWLAREGSRNTEKWRIPIAARAFDQGVRRARQLRVWVTQAAPDGQSRCRGKKRLSFDIGHLCC
jgi:hypothetical protein